MNADRCIFISACVARDMDTGLNPPMWRCLVTRSEAADKTASLGLSDGVNAYLLPRRVVTSKITASTSTKPRTTYWRAISVPIRFMPLVSDM